MEKKEEGGGEELGIETPWLEFKKAWEKAGGNAGSGPWS